MGDDAPWLAEVPVGELAGAGLDVRFGPPDAIVHLDLHPGNIMLTADGPVVFDWSNVALGPPAADVALAWVIGATSTVDRPRWERTAAQLLHGRMVARFVAACGRVEAACSSAPECQTVPSGTSGTRVPPNTRVDYTAARAK